jgi:alpha-beta hydrolase superfamily lysophospholipase
VCGFAWVTLRPANSSFAIWAKKNRDWKPAYGGGMQLWVSAYNQSMKRKEAYATAFANVLYASGIKAYAGSRMD